MRWAQHVRARLPDGDQSPSNSRALLQSAYRNSLTQAVRNGYRTVVRVALTQAFPLISTGAFGYPIKDAASAALEQVAAFLLGPDGSAIDRVIFCAYSEDDYKVYEACISKVF